MQRITETEFDDIFYHYLKMFRGYTKLNILKNVTYVLLEKPCIENNSCKIRDIAQTGISFGNYAEMIYTNKILQDRYIAEAIVAHEFGHVIDPWLKDNLQGKEKRADMLAELVTGNRIYYNKDKIQTFSKGEFPRPSGIHQ